MENYFRKCYDVNQVKKEFRRLLFQFHSDINKNSSDDKTKSLILQYHDKLKRLNNSQSNMENKKFTYVYDVKTESIIIEKINELLNLSMRDVEILLIGSFLWVNGSTIEYKEHLKLMGFRWQSIKKSWFYTPLKYKKVYSKTSLEDIKIKYGVNYIDNKKNLIDVKI